MNRNIIILIGVGIIGAILFTKGFFVVRPDQFAIVTEFGEPIETISEAECLEPKGAAPDSEECKRPYHKPAPGFYFRIPFIQDVRYLDARVRGWDDEARDTKTVELRTIDFIAFARWRIIDPLKFYTAAKTEKKAMGGMDSIVTARIQTAIRENKLAAIVRDRGRDYEARASLNLLQLVADYEECRPEKDPAIKNIIQVEQEQANRLKAPTSEAEAQRAEIVERIRLAANQKLGDEFGIKIEDLHFKYLNYSRQVHAKMIDAIKQDRKRDIEQYKKIGNACTGTIQAARETEKGKLLGEKDREVRRLIGEANAKAIALKAQAFNQDPDFFRFLRTLEVYQKSLKSGTKLILSSDSPLLALMKDERLMASVKKIDLPKPAAPGKAPSLAPKKDTKASPPKADDTKAAGTDAKDAKAAKDAKDAKADAKKDDGAEKKKVDDKKAKKPEGDKKADAKGTAAKPAKAAKKD